MVSQPRHLLNRNGRYFARLVIPKELRPFLDNKTELREALGADRRGALASLHPAVAKLQGLIAVAERKCQLAMGKPIEPGRYPLPVDEIALRNYHERLRFDEELRNAGKSHPSVGIDDRLVGFLREGIAGKLTDDMLDRLVGQNIERFKRLGNTTVVFGSDEWRTLARAMCVSELEALSRMAERDEGDYTGVPEHPLIASQATAGSEPLEPVSLRALLDSYLKELERDNKGREARRRWSPVFDDLIRFVGHDDALRLTDKKLLEWRNKKLETLAAKTVSDVYMASVRAVMTWAFVDKIIPLNPTDGVRVKKSKPIRVREQGYRDDEAQALLKASRSYAPEQVSNPANRESTQTTAAKHWTPLLCAFTGARIVEITQLRKQDVRVENGIPVVRITPEAGSVKTGHYRDVPLHDQIVSLGFLRFVEQSADGSLFHSAPPEKALQGARTTAGRVSQWLKTLDVVPAGIKPNHGWRHRFKTVGRELAISDRVLDAIQGHASRTAGEQYGDVTITTMKAALDRIPSFEL
ncbi:tyrosine-type recombinase/integrase [Brucella rhizosphaerae]|uniref:tyrosine-type recombinase/integrase n=1 Tax=Brucella rhizosphaerae TaxID=571254 RepID=UPI00046476C4|nr:tyrosine-type recombinase/integrase [Brucella rhizosphaerae]